MSIKKLLLSIIFGFSALLFTAPVGVGAQGFDPLDSACSEGAGSQSGTCDERTDVNPISGNDGVLLSAVFILSIAVGVIAIIVMIVNGISMITSQGDPQKIANSRSAIIYAVVGLVVVVMGRSIIIFIVNRV